jgi:hypothetical protein
MVVLWKRIPVIQALKFERVIVVHRKVSCSHCLALAVIMFLTPPDYKEEN